MRKFIIFCMIVILGLGVFIGVSEYKNRGGNIPALKKAKEIMRNLIKTSARPAELKEVKGEIDIRNAFVKVADEVGKAVVTISTERTRKMEFQSPRMRFRRFGPGSPFNEEDSFDKFFEDFFGQMPEGGEFTQKGLGSGFIVDKEGRILTNYHVVAETDKITVTLSDGRSFEGVLVGADQRMDLAVVKIKAKDLPAAELGDSDLLQVGEWVVALGNPFGNVLRSPKPTVTVGVVSALHRQIPTPGSGDAGYLNMIQTDAAINPGNSGGPLCDLNGKVIGINVVIFSTSGGYQGLGFAIPVNDVKEVLNDLIEGKEVSYGWLGVSVQEITAEMASYFDLPDTKGALVSQIVPRSQAEKAGLKEGDVITAIDGVKIDTLHDLLRGINKKKPGQVLRLEIIRDKTKSVIEATIEKRPQGAELAQERQMKAPATIEKWRGMRIIEITDEMAREFGLENTEGVVIVEIDRGSVAYYAGLRRGDIIREINKTKIGNIVDYKNIISEAKGPALVRTESGYFIVKEPSGQ